MINYFFQKSVQESSNMLRIVFSDFFLTKKLDEIVVSLENFIGSEAVNWVKDLILVTLENPPTNFELSAKLLNYALVKKWTTMNSILNELATSVEELSTDTPKDAESLAIFMAKLMENNIITMNNMNLMATKNGDKEGLVKFISFTIY